MTISPDWLMLKSAYRFADMIRFSWPAASALPWECVKPGCQSNERKPETGGDPVPYRPIATFALARGCCCY